MRLWLALLAALGSALAQNAPSPGVTLSVHILVACGPGAGRKVPVADATSPLCLDRTAFLTQDDVQSAEIQQSSKGTPRVFLTFHDAAAVRELQVTRKNIGNYVAIVLNGKVVSSTRISAGSRLLYIDDNYTRPQADQIVMAFNRYVASAQRKGPAK